MALKVYKVAVVGCPRAVISPEGILDGVGKSCLCNRFVRSEAYTEEHQRESSEISHDEWSHNTVFNGDHFVYWGAANKNLPDKSRVRFQVVEQTEFYKAPKPAKGSGSEESSSSSSSEDEEMESRRRRRRRRHSKRDLFMPDEPRLIPHQAPEGYISRASAIHFRSRKQGKMAYRLKAVEAAVRRSSGPVRAAMQLFPNEDFGGKKSVGIYGFVCVFDPTLEGEHMQRQLNYLKELLPALAKKRKVVIACVKCDAVEDHAIRFGSELSSYALKKTIPFFEVSARDSVNVDDVFFSLVCAPRKSAKNGFPGYRETIDSRKGDLNRMKDAFRKSLQLTVTDFSSTWSDTLPLLKMDRSYQALKQVAGNEADEMIVKLFQLRLIEIKLMEATKKFGHSLVKKADKEKSKEHQVYLKEAFSGHPDLRGESYRDYLPSLSVSDEMESLLTEPSTPSSSICPTPDMMHLRSNTLPDLPLSSEDLRNMEKKLPTYALLQQKRHFSFATPATGQTPPPLPARKSAHIASPSERKLSNSTDCLFSPDEADPQARRNLIKSSPQVVASYDRLDAEPYLQPQEVKMVLRHSSVGQGEPQLDFGDGAVAAGGGGRRNVPGFHSMRVPNKRAPRTMISNNTSANLREAKVNYSSSSLDRRTHKRSRSNPFVLEGTNLGDLLTPPQLPPRNMTDSTTSQTTPTHASPGTASKCESTLESSLEFASPTLKPLPPIPGEPDNSSVFRTSRIPTSKSIEEENGLDNISQASGPFEEIETPEETPKRKQSSPLPVKRQPGVGLARSATMGPKVNIAAGLVPSHSPSTDSDEDDQYAEITDFQNQQYVQMASAPIEKGKGHPSSDDTDSITSGKKKNKKSSLPSATLPISIKRKAKKSQQPSKEKGNESPTQPPVHTRAASTSILYASAPPVKPSPSHSVIPDVRPLPPSPTKGISRKISSGSNIYEVIDEEFLNRVRNRPSRQNSQKEAALLEFIPPVDRALWSSYFEVVRRFFNLPIVQEKWEECVKAAMTDADPGDIKPPYPKFWEGSQIVNETLEEEQEEQESRGDKDVEEEEKRDSVTPLHETAAERAVMGTSLSHRQRAKTTTAITIATAESAAGKTNKEKSSVPSSSSAASSGGLQASTLPAVALSQQKSPVMERLMKISQQKSPAMNRAQQLSPATARKSPVPERSVLQQLTPSPTLRLSQSPGGSSVGGHRLQNSAGSDDLILMLNQSQNYESSEDDESDLSDGDEFDLDSVSSTSSESLQQLNAEKAATAPPPPRPTPPAVPAHGNPGRATSSSASSSGPHPSPRPSSHPPPVPKAPTAATAATSSTGEPYYQTPRQVFGEDYYQTPKQVLGEDYYQIPKEVMKDDDDYYQTPQEVMGEDYYQTPKEVFEYYQTPKQVFAEKAEPTQPPTHTQIPKEVPKEKSVVKKPPPPPRSPIKSPTKPTTKYPTKSSSKPPVKPPAVKPKPRNREGSIPETDLDAAIERRASESSDRIMTPSPSTLTPPPPPLTQAKPHPSPLHPLHRKDVAPLELKTSIDSTDSAGPGKAYTNGVFSLTSADESDLVSTDSALTKSPHSWIGGGEFDLERAASESESSDVKMRASDKGDNKSEGTPERAAKEEEGVKVVHNVRPSDFLKKRGYRTKSKGSSVSGSLTDSGHFEESVFSPST